MVFTALALVAGLLAGRLLGGRLQHLGDRDFRGWPLLAAGLLVQAGAAAAGAHGPVLVLVSYVALLAFTLANLRLVGMWLVAAGLAMNTLTIGVNGGMPVRASAVVAAGIVNDHADLRHVRITGKRHLERPGDRLMAISDIIPVRWLREVLSLGDVVMAVGVAGVAAHLMLPVPARLRRDG